VSTARRQSASVLVALAVLATVAASAYLVVHARSARAGALAPMASIDIPGALPQTVATDPSAVSWLVAKAREPLTVFKSPSASAGVRTVLPTLDSHGYPTVLLVQTYRQAGGETWYKVWLAKRPNGSSGWVRATNVGTYSTSAKIVIDVSARRLSVYRGGALRGRFTVAVGTAAYPTPTGFFFIDEKIRPSASGGVYGVLAMGLSAFQPLLPTLGSLAIHGTNDSAIIGRAVSDGCIRMHNADVLKVSAWVPSGSPVVIQP
jgi:lipoprotein-anchoring transpeptidase ErfK/SrfK